MSNYFYSVDPIVILGNIPSEIEARNPTVFPRELTSRLSTYKTHPKLPFQNITDALTGTEILFDFSAAYNEDILVYHQTGGGKNSINALRHMQAQEEIIAAYQRRLGAIGTSYVSLHIRHTDYQSDFKHVIYKALRQPRPILLCTDNQKIKDKLLASTEAKRIFNFTSDLGSTDSPIHLKPTTDLGAAIQRRRNFDAIVDLLMLASSSQIFAAPIIGRIDKKRRISFKRPFLSGFSSLALSLQKNPQTLRRLLTSV
jgi:hypothetical protein